MLPAGAIPAPRARQPGATSAPAHAAETGDWRASPSKLCDWCDHKPLCPAWGGTPPPLPEGAVEIVLGERASALAVPGLDEE